jgi:hydrogenase maturation factor
MERGIVMAGYAGNAGAAKLIAENEVALKNRFPGFFVDTVGTFAKDAYDEAAEDFLREKENIYRVAECVKVSDGGVFAALWELGESERIGFAVELKQIPVRQETIEICNYLDIDPYRLYAKGCILILAEYAERLAGDLKKAGIPAAVIGREHSEKKRVVYYDDEERFLEPRKGDSILETNRN